MHRTVLFLAVIALVVTSSIALAVDAPKWIGAFPIQSKVGLKWQPAEGAEAYAIYRSVAGAPAEKLSEVSQTQYFDEAVEAGETYEYTIKAVAGGAEGPASEPKSVTMPGVKSGEMKGPDWVGVREDRGQLYLRWVPQTGTDIVAYNLQRSKTSGGPYETIASIQETKYVDRNFEPGETYYYVITALDANFQESPRSEERSFTAAGVDASEQAEEPEERPDTPVKLLFTLKEAGERDLQFPVDVAVGSDGRIYVADGGRVAVFDNTGAYLQDIGSAKMSASGTAEDGYMSGAYTLALDQSDNLYVADIKTRDVQKFDKDGNFLQRFATSTIEGEKPVCPIGLAVLSDGSMYLSDRDNSRILKLDAQGEVLWTRGRKGSGDGEFAIPNEIAVNSQGEFYVVDVFNQRIQKFDASGEHLAKFGSAGNTVGTFARPKGLCVDDQDRVWVADGMSNVIQVWSTDHEVVGAVGIFEDESLAFSNPRGVAVSGNRLLVVDRNHHRVMVFEIL